MYVQMLKDDKYSYDSYSKMYLVTPEAQPPSYQ